MTESARGQYGGVPIPAVAPAPGFAVTDRALSVIGLYLQAFLNAYAAVPWEAVSHLDKPVKTVFTHDPRKRWFNERDLPALYLYRIGGAPERFASDYRILRDKVMALWVFSVAKAETQHLRDPFVAGVVKLIDDAIERTRDPSFLLAGDPDPSATDFGSNVFRAAGADGVSLERWDIASISVPVPGEPAARTYDGVALTLELVEHDLRSLEPFDAPYGVDVSLSLTTSDGAVVAAEYLDAQS